MYHGCPLAVKPAAVTSRLRYAFLGGLQTPDQVAMAVSNALQLTGGTTAIDASYRTLARVSAEDVMTTASAVGCFSRSAGNWACGHSMCLKNSGV